MRVVSHRKRLPRQVVDAQSLETFRARSASPVQSKVFYESMTQKLLDSLLNPV